MEDEATGPEQPTSIPKLFWAFVGFMFVSTYFYGWQEKRGFKEYSRLNDWCMESNFVVKSLWMLTIVVRWPLGMLCAWNLKFMKCVWNAVYRCMDSFGQKHCPGCWERARRCGAHLSGTCWYVSSSAVVAIDEAMESERAARTLKGRTSKDLKRRANEQLQAAKSKGLQEEATFLTVVATLKEAMEHVDGWWSPYKELRSELCKELGRRIVQCLSGATDIAEECRVFESKTDLNLGKEDVGTDTFHRSSVFDGAGQMEALCGYLDTIEEVGASLSNDAFDVANPKLEDAAKSRVQWARKEDKPKPLQYALFCAAELRQQTLPEVKSAATRYKEIRNLPTDWDVLSMAGSQKYGMRLLRKVTIGGPLLGAVPIPGTLMASLQQLLDDSFIMKVTRDRRDGLGVPHRLVIVSATLIQNEQNWVEYAQSRERVRAELKAKPLEQKERFGDHMKHSKLMDSKAASRLPNLDAEVQEAWLFHGTNAAGAEGITTNDFRISLAGSGAGTLYGRGIYLAEACSKSDEYTAEAELGTDRHLLLCRAVLGRVWYTAESRPDTQALEDRCKGGGYHSVLGDREKARGTFREFMVYDDDQVYPAYIICYRRQKYAWKD